jgi:hypothetical protein
MRACVDCAHWSDPTTSPHCPECGSEQLPKDWTVVLREPSPWVWRGAHIGSLVYLLTLALWINGLVSGGKGPNPGSFVVLAMFCFPLSVAHLRGKRLDDIWILRDRGIEHRSRTGTKTLHEPEDGWACVEVRQHKRNKHLWLLKLERPKRVANPVPGRPKPKGQRTVKIEVDDRVHDPRVVERAVRRSLTPASASDTSAGAA